MSSTHSNFRTVMVVGNNPTEMLKEYSKKLKVESYIKYEFKNAEKMRQEAINTNKKIVEDPKKFGFTEFQVETLKEIIKKYSKLDGFQYYQMMTYGMPYDEYGNALSDKNPKGKWSTYKIGGNFSLPFITKDGKEVYSALQKDVDWKSVHMNNQEIYRAAWEVVVDGRKPANEQEEIIYKNMKNKKNYWENFESKEDYVAYNCSRWYYAVLNEDGWLDADDGDGNINNWIKEYYDKFILPLPDDALLTVFEYTSIDTDDE